MSVYYNENDPFAAQWLTELIAENLIAPGDVDDRSIADVQSADLSGYAQVHLFAGIGVWSRALRNAGWPDDRPIWTGSCPCQPFSAAGRREGLDDPRHLWPEMFRLVRECQPEHVLGEQVASGGGLVWFDAVSADLEGAGYAVGAVDTCAAGVGAPHIRQRLYWLADTVGERVRGAGRGADAGAAAAVERSARQWQRLRDDAGPVGDGGIGRSGLPDPADGYWRDVDWLLCRDARWRPVEPGTFPLAHAGTFRNRVAELRGAGNALCLAQAEAFIRACIDALTLHGAPR